MERLNLGPTEWAQRPELARETYARMTAEGILLASLDERGRLCPMTIGWGLWGGVWGREIFAVFVRPSRYTYACLDHTGAFTVNVLPEELKDVADYCGSTSSALVDKVAEKDLQIAPSRSIDVPGLAAANIIYECRIVHENDVMPPNLAREISGNYYPDGDFHRIFFGEIVNVSVSAKAKRLGD